MRADTVHMAALTLNTIEKALHIVWQVPNLPFDCRRIQTVPRPLGTHLPCLFRLSILFIPLALSFCVPRASPLAVSFVCSLHFLVGVHVMPPALAARSILV